MNLVRRSLIAVSVVAVGICSTPAVHASTVSPVHAMFAKVKTVGLTLRNDTRATVELQAGDSVMKLEAGKSMTVKLPIGTRIVTNTDTAKVKAGTLIIEVSPDLNGGTIAIN